MTINVIIGLIFALVFAAFVWRVIGIVWKERRDKNRGSDLKSGYHIIHSEYSSGVSGHQTTYKVPCDPQEYARLFVPQTTEK